MDYARLSNGLLVPERLTPPRPPLPPIAGGGSAPLWLLQNGAMPTTAALVKVTTGTAIKTMLQVQLSAGTLGRIREWGISFDGSAAATPIEVELIETGTVFATVTAFATADVMPLNSQAIAATVADYFTLGTGASGYTASAEGTITAVRYLDAAQLLPPTGPFVLQLPLGAEGDMRPTFAYRIRVTAGAAVSAYCYMKVET